VKVKAMYEKTIDGLLQAICDMDRRLDALYEAHAAKGHAEWDKPAETWRDVSRECEIVDDHGSIIITHKGVNVMYHALGYRVRKVTLYAGYCSPTQVDAFIIEKREGA
jgi:hypothetical protein